MGYLWDKRSILKETPTTSQITAQHLKIKPQLTSLQYKSEQKIKPEEKYSVARRNRNRAIRPKKHQQQHWTTAPRRQQEVSENKAYICVRGLSYIL